MSGILQLDVTMEESPQAWQNFFESCCGDGPTDQWGDVTVEYINSKLEQYRGSYCEEQLAIVFDSERSYTWFMLRWT